MSKKNTPAETSVLDQINVTNLVQQIFQDIYNDAHKAEQCVQCHSIKLQLTDEENCVYKCSDCKFSFSPRTNSLYQKIRYPHEKWFKFLTCMVTDRSLEETVKIVASNAESVKRRWTILYEQLDWNKYNLLVRDKPIKNIYADFDVIIG